MDCSCDPKYNCSSKTGAGCVHYLGELPEWSSLVQCPHDCVLLSDVIEDIYKELTRIRESIDTSNMNRDSHCIDYGSIKNGELTVKQILFALESRICRG